MGKIFVFAAALAIVFFAGCPVPPEDNAVSPDQNIDVQQQDQNFCGNGILEIGENCLNCPQDANCAADEYCAVDGKCKKLCGNGVVDANESCSSCPADVKCAENEECVLGECIETEQPDQNAEQQDQNIEENGGLPEEPPAGSKSFVEMELNTRHVYLSPGDSVIVDGKYTYKGWQFKIELENVLQTGYYDYTAKFNIYDQNGTLLAFSYIEPESEVIFYDSSGNQIYYDTFLYVDSISISA